MADTNRNAPAWVTWLLELVGVLCLIAAVIYLSKPASSLPGFFPGHDAALHGNHTKHGLGMIGLAVVAWAAAWFTTGTKRVSAS